MFAGNRYNSLNPAMSVYIHFPACLETMSKENVSDIDIIFLCGK